MTNSPTLPLSNSLTGPHAGLAPCVHCGFCLPACPTYEVTADEADSPRGRIVLMQALARGEMAAADPGLQEHLDRCLGCRGCESVCPSGVLFGPALEAARADIARARPLPLALRAALWILARPERQRLLWLAARALRWTGVPAWLARGAGRNAPAAARQLAMLAATAGNRQSAIGNRESGIGNRDGSGGSGQADSRLPIPDCRLFRGCIMDGLFSHVHQATIECCHANGIGVEEVPGQVCCGALAAHAGATDLAADLARENVRAFAATDGPILVNSAGCGAMIKSYGDLLAADALEADARRVAARIRDVSEVLADRGPKTGHRLSMRVAYDAPCHLLHAQKIATAPLQLLAAIPGLELEPLEGSERCCGAAGLYALIEPAMSQEVLEHKLDAIRRAAPDVVATGNPGCAMHIGAGLLLDGQPTVVRHPVELLAWSYRA